MFMFIDMPPSFKVPVWWRKKCLLLQKVEVNLVSIHYPLNTKKTHWELGNFVEENWNFCPPNHVF